jgi:hypothetical protein
VVVGAAGPDAAFAGFLFGFGAGGFGVGLPFRGPDDPFDPQRRQCVQDVRDPLVHVRDGLFGQA